MKTLLGTLLLFLIPAAGYAQTNATEEASYREFTDTTGKYTVVARLIDYNAKEKSVTLERKEDKERIELPLTKLSDKDRRWVADEVNRRSRAASKENKPKTGAAAYDEFIEPWRSRFVKDWEAAVESLKDEIAGARKRAREAKNSKSLYMTPKTILARAAKDKERLAELQKNNPPYFKGLSRLLDTWQIGDYGAVYSAVVVNKTAPPARVVIDGQRVDDPSHAVATMPVVIIQVIEPDRVLLGGERSGPVIMLKLDSTAGLVDGRQFDFGGRFVSVTGTTTYATARGGTKTVPVAEFLNLDTIKNKK